MRRAVDFPHADVQGQFVDGDDVAVALGDPIEGDPAHRFRPFIDG
jgi:hypothetical protein